MRRVLRAILPAVSVILLAGGLVGGGPVRLIRIAMIVESWYPHSHADVIGTRIQEGYRLEGRYHASPLTIVSVYTEAPRPDDRTREVAARYGFRVAGSIADALLVDAAGPRPELAVDGIVVATREDLPREGAELPSPTPRLRTMREILRVLDRAGGRVPIFIDKMLAANWQDSRTIVAEASRRGVPLMAGSVLSFMPVEPPLRRGRVAAAAVITSAPYWAYAFHAAELLQTYMEQRTPRETGIASIRSVGRAYWQRPDRDIWGGRVVDALLQRTQPGSSGPAAPQEAAVLLIEYRDGSRAVLALVPRLVDEGTFLLGAQLEDGTLTTGTVRLPGPPFDHFGYLAHALAGLFTTGRSPAPVERTLLTTGITLQGYISGQGAPGLGVPVTYPTPAPGP